MKKPIDNSDADILILCGNPTNTSDVTLLILHVKPIKTSDVLGMLSKGTQQFYISITNDDNVGI